MESNGKYYEKAHEQDREQDQGTRSWGISEKNDLVYVWYRRRKMRKWRG